MSKGVYERGISCFVIPASFVIRNSSFSQAAAKDRRDPLSLRTRKKAAEPLHYCFFFSRSTLCAVYELITASRILVAGESFVVIKSMFPSGPITTSPKSPSTW